MSTPTVVLYVRVPPQVKEDLDRLVLREFKRGTRYNGKAPSQQAVVSRILSDCIARELAAPEAEDQLDLFTKKTALASKPVECGQWNNGATCTKEVGHGGLHYSDDAKRGWGGVSVPALPEFLRRPMDLDDEPEDPEADAAALAALDREAEHEAEHEDQAEREERDQRAQDEHERDARPEPVKVAERLHRAHRKGQKRVEPALVDEYQPNDLVTIQWSPTVTRLARFVRWTKSRANAIVRIQRVNAKGKPLVGKFGEPRDVAARDVLGVVSRRTA